jgi:hypothetical protein
MRHVASFRQFLSTGRLGPISTDLNLRQVADLLGTPQDWIFNYDAPFYWIYSEIDNDRPKLEIAFSADAPHPVEWFQIEDANDICDTFHLFGQSLTMTTDGLSGASTPAEYLRSGAFDVDNTTLYLDEYFELAIVTDRIVVYFYRIDGAGDDMNGDEKRVIFGGFGKRLEFSKHDSVYRIDSIASHPEGGTAWRWADRLLTRATCSIPQYLGMIGDPPDSTAQLVRIQE